MYAISTQWAPGEKNGAAGAGHATAPVARGGGGRGLLVGDDGFEPPTWCV